MNNEFSRRKFLEGLALGSACAYGLPSLIDVAKASPLAQPREQENTVVETLLPHQLESGIVTRQELALAEKWLTQATATSDGEEAQWVDAWLGTALPFSFQYGGKPSSQLLRSWKLQVGDPKSGPEAVEREFAWDDPATGLRVIWTIKQFTHSPAVDWVLHFENKGSGDTPILEDIQALDFRIKHSQKDQPYTVHGALGGRALPDDGMPFSWKVPDSIGNYAELMLGGDMPTMHSHLPFFNLETPEHRGVMVGVGWSGNWIARVTVQGAELRVRTGMKETHFVLRPGERVRTPRALVLFWEGKRLHGHNMLRQLLHRSYAPRLRGKPPEPLTSVNMAVALLEKNHFFLEQANQKNVMPMVKPFIQLGAEVFIVDAGWYQGSDTEDWRNGIGDWQPSRSKYPDGFRPLSDPLAAANIAFGLWFDTENTTPNTPVAREHPDFIRSIVSKPVCSVPDGKLPGIPVDWFGCPDPHHPQPRLRLRMELPEVREWFAKCIDHLVQDQGLGCYRHDQGTGFGKEPDDRVGFTESQHYAGLYELWDTMKSRHPNLLWEGAGEFCGCPDLELVSRFHWGQYFDRYFYIESDQLALYGANLYLPGGLLTMFSRTTDDYTAWSSFAGQFSMAWRPQDADFPMEQALRQVERYKRIRPYLSGDFYPLTPCSLDETWIGYQFHRFDLDQGFCLIFRRPTSEQAVFPANDTFQARLRGLRPGNYRVKFEGNGRVQTISSEVLTKGTDVVLQSLPAAEMMIYERIA